MDSIYLARQPILDINKSLYAYEILYLDSTKQAHFTDDRYASASVINSILNTFGTKEFVSKHKSFVKVDEKFLLSDLVMTIPTEFFTLSLFDDIEMGERVVERIGQLYDKGFSLAINDTELTTQNILKYRVVLDKLTYFKINIYLDMGIENKDAVIELQDAGIKVVATKIEEEYQYQIAKDLECDLYQGYWFAKPKIIENEKFDPSQHNVLKLYNMLLDGTNIDEIASEFEKNHTLTLHLLQFINSGAFHFRNKISSIHHILTLVGRKPLSEWLMLMIYSKSISDSDKVSPLMLMVKNRTELMQEILKALKPDVKSNALGEAYLIGVLSLIDTVFGVKLEEILESIHISDVSKKALLNDEGTLGLIYKVIRDIEEFNVVEIDNFCKKYKLATDLLQDIIIKSMQEVNSFENALKGFK
ncbi:MAG: HDOD domain-containing protein [Sulfurimonas sp.]|nr:HDOD domain-containing protein [Sulfurimonas sp.]